MYVKISIKPNICSW